LSFEETVGVGKRGGERGIKEFRPTHLGHLEERNLNRKKR